MTNGSDANCTLPEDASLSMGDLKTKREIAKLDVDIANARHANGLERLKAWAALLAPVMTAATILGTVFIGYVQVKSKSESDEDQNWRQTIQAIDQSKSDLEMSRNYSTLLLPFLQLPRYRARAVGVTVSALPKLRDPGTFRELFDAVFDQRDAKLFFAILDIDRQLSAAIHPLEAERARLRQQEAEVPGLNDAATAARGNVKVQGQDERVDDQLQAIDREISVAYSEVALMCDKIADGLKNIERRKLFDESRRPYGTGSRIPLNNVYFEQCDLSGVDFTGLDMTGAVFNRVALDGSTLASLDGSDPFLWAYIAWWRAATVEPKLLKSLLANFKPNQFKQPGFSDSYRGDEIVTRSEWESSIARLCSKANITCTKDSMRADFVTQVGK